jgi:dihydrofolate reductase
VGKVVVIEFVTLDGVIEDPDGSGGTSAGGWAFRFGPESVAGDKFKLGPMLDSGTLLLGRSTWELFARIWPGRSDQFAQAMNRMPKLVVSHGAPDVGAWSNSRVLEGNLATEVARLRQQRDLVVAGSTSVARTLAGADLVDEYRLLIFPTVLGRGERLFADGAVPVDLRLVSAEPAGAAALVRYERASA